MGHNSVCGGEDDMSELTGGQKIGNPLFDFTVFNIESWGNYTAFVQTSSKFDNDFSGTVIIDDLELSDVSCTIFLNDTIGDICVR